MKQFLAIMVLAIVLLISTGCGTSSGPDDPGDTSPPEVVTSSPESGTADLGLLQHFEVTFSEAMDPASLSEETVSISGRGDGLHIIYDETNHSLWAAPESLLAQDAELSFNITGASDASGNELEAFAIDFGTGPFDCEHLADRFEPNEDVASATPIDLDTLIPSLATCSEDFDFFSFTLEEAAKVTVTTFITHAEKDPEEEWDHTAWGIHWLYDQDMVLSTLGAGADTGGSASYHYSFLPGTYYLKIFGQNNEVDVVYDLLLETDTACDDDIYEDNDFEEFATIIEPGVYMLRGCYVDVDWFKFPVESGQTIDVNMDGFDTVGLRYLAVSEPGGNSYYSGACTDNPLGDPVEVSADGEANIRVQFWVDDVDYELTLEITD